MSFANPIWLWCLSGLTIPVAIHLLSRKEGRVIPVGSVRHFEENETAQFSSLRLNEILLLVLRCLIMVLITLFLAGLNLDFISPKKQKWLVIDSGIEKNIPAATLDTLIAEGYEKHYLGDNFPTNKSQTSIKNNWYLADQLKNKNIDAIVFTANRIHDFWGQRISKPENIRWVVVDQKDTSDIIGTLRLSNDSVWARTASSSIYLTQLSSLKMLSPANNRGNSASFDLPNDTIIAAIHFTPEFAEDAKIIHASLLTVQSIVPIKLSIHKNPVDFSTADCVFWLSREPSPDLGHNSFSIEISDNQNRPMIVSRFDEAIINKDLNTEWLFTRRLSEVVAIQEKLPLQLATILLPKFDTDQYNSSLPEEFTWSSKQSQPQNTQLKNDAVNMVLFFLLIAVTITERWIAFKRKI